jgi:hypothetical protein
MFEEWKASGVPGQDIRDGKQMKINVVLLAERVRRMSISSTLGVLFSPQESM